MNHYLMRTIEFGPVVLERILARVPESRYDGPTDPGRFTIREVVAHLADWEPILRLRISGICDDPGTVIQVYDEGRLAIDNRYSEQDVSENLGKLKTERSRTVALLTALSPEEWHRTGQHPEVGTLSVYDIAGMIQGHDMYHLEQVSSYL